MQLSHEAQAILAIFAKHKVGVGQYLPVGAVYEGWPDTAREQWEASLTSLVDEGYIFRDAIGHGLTEKGLDAVNALGR